MPPVWVIEVRTSSSSDGFIPWLFISKSGVDADNWLDSTVGGGSRVGGLGSGQRSTCGMGIKQNQEEGQHGAI